MPQLKVPQDVLDDLKKFIVERYPYYLPNSLLVAQTFILVYQNYGREFSLTEINCAIEDVIKQGLFL